MKYVFEDTSECINRMSDALEKKYNLEPVMSVDYSVKPPVCKCNTPDGWVNLNIGDSIEI